MVELGQLERRHGDFARQNTRVIVISMEGLDDAAKTQRDFPHLIVLADSERKLSEAMELVHARAGRMVGDDADYPTSFLVDNKGTVRWLHRSSVIERPSPDEVLEAIDRHLPAEMRQRLGE
jgi:peroxiredoxin